MRIETLNEGDIRGQSLIMEGGHKLCGEGGAKVYTASGGIILRACADHIICDTPLIINDHLLSIIEEAMEVVSCSLNNFLICCNGPPCFEIT